MSDYSYSDVPDFNPDEFEYIGFQEIITGQVGVGVFVTPPTIESNGSELVDAFLQSLDSWAAITQHIMTKEEAKEIGAIRDRAYYTPGEVYERGIRLPAGLRWGIVKDGGLWYLVVVRSDTKNGKS